jgi:hypothetical protein
MGSRTNRLDFVIPRTDEVAKAERTKALDPALSPDPGQAREAMAAAEFARDRLRNELPELQKRYQVALAVPVSDLINEAHWCRRAEEIRAARLWVSATTAARGIAERQ